MELNRYYLDAIELDKSEDEVKLVLRRYLVASPTAAEAYDRFMNGEGVLDQTIDIGQEAFVVDLNLYNESA